MLPLVAPLTAAAAAPTDYGWLGNIVVDIMEAVGPIGVGLAVFAENIFPPIPSEVILPLAGFTAAGGAFSPHAALVWACLLYTSPSPRDATLSRMPSSA